MSNSFSTEFFDKLYADLGLELHRILSTDEFKAAKQAALECLTEEEFRILVMKYQIGMSLDEIAERLNVPTRQAAEARVKSVIEIVKLYIAYFARFDHEYVNNNLESYVGPAAKPMREVFAGRKSGKRLTNAYDRITNEDISGFIQLVSSLSRFTRT